MAWQIECQNHQHRVALASLQAANPVLFVLAVAVVALGAARRWLVAEETLLAAGLLPIRSRPADTSWALW